MEYSTNWHQQLQGFSIHPSSAWGHQKGSKKVASRCQPFSNSINGKILEVSDLKQGAMSREEKSKALYICCLHSQSQQLLRQWTIISQKSHFYSMMSAKTSKNITSLISSESLYCIVYFHIVTNIIFSNPLDVCTPFLNMTLGPGPCRGCRGRWHGSGVECSDQGSKNGEVWPGRPSNERRVWQPPRRLEGEKGLNRCTENDTCS